MKSIIFLIALLGLISCKGGGGSNTEASTSSPLTFEGIIGTWSTVKSGTPCTQSDGLNLESYASFSQGEVRKVFMLANFVHVEADCSDSPTLMHSIGYEPTLSDDMIDFSLIDENYWIMDSEFVDLANSQNLCGFNDWKLKEFRSVAGTVCSINPNDTFRWTNILLRPNSMTITNPDDKQVILYPSDLGLNHKMQAFIPKKKTNKLFEELFNDFSIRESLTNQTNNLFL